ncbi:MAG: hypothetical protein ACK2T5_17610 [Anaerolineales bacterium]
MENKNELSADTILEAEFEYIATTATQANEDRSKVASFYFVSVGSLIAAIFSALFDTDQDKEVLQNIYFAFCTLFGFLTILGYLTIAQLARLRTAWMDSVKAMNTIKKYYIENVETDLKPAFLWTNEYAPKGYKPGSVANYLAYQVALLSGLIFAATIFFFQLGIEQTNCLWPISIGLGIFIAILQVFFYWKVVSKTNL